MRLIPPPFLVSVAIKERNNYRELRGKLKSKVIAACPRVAITKEAHSYTNLHFQILSKPRHEYKDDSVLKYEMAKILS